VDAAENNDIGIGSGRFDGETERVAGNVGNLLHFIAHVVMRQEYAVVRFQECPYFVDQFGVGHGRPSLKQV
jgi:hypothetical protein